MDNIVLEPPTVTDLLQSNYNNTNASDAAHYSSCHERTLDMFSLYPYELTRRLSGTIAISRKLLCTKSNSTEQTEVCLLRPTAINHRIGYTKIKIYAACSPTDVEEADDACSSPSDQLPVSAGLDLLILATDMAIHFCS